jgi:hypothetical protein
MNYLKLMARLCLLSAMFDWAFSFFTPSFSIPSALFFWGMGTYLILLAFYFETEANSIERDWLNKENKRLKDDYRNRLSDSGWQLVEEEVSDA